MGLFPYTRPTTRYGDQVLGIQQALQEQQQHRGCKRRYIQKEGHLTVGGARELAQKASTEEGRPTQPPRLNQPLEKLARAANMQPLRRARAYNPAVWSTAGG